jgi:YfiH family protein
VITQVDVGNGVHLAVTGRSGGVSASPYDTLNLGGRVGDDPLAVAENRARIAAAVGVDRDHLVLMAQVHSADVAVLRAPPSEPLRVDAMVTDVPGLALVAMGADCAPVMITDPGRGLLGVAHCGRLGLVRRVVEAVVAALRDLGAVEMVARVGPAICGRCYEVPTDLRAEVAAVAPDGVATTQWGTPGVDVGAGALGQLRSLGVAAERLGGCTYEDVEGCYSYRRDGVTGRHAGIIWRAAA